MFSKHSIKTKFAFIAVLLMTCILVSTLPARAEWFNLPPDSPFWGAGGGWLNTDIVREGLYDLEPTALYEPNAPDNMRFKIWWQGQKNWPSADDERSFSENRIFYSFSEYGFVWTEPRPVYDTKTNGVFKPLFGAEPRNAADDHLIGMPSVIKVNGKYYMFYSGIANSARVINRYIVDGDTDTWTTSDYIVPSDWRDRYRYEKTLGYAPGAKKNGTHPIYSNVVTYNDFGGKENRYLSKQKLEWWKNVFQGGPQHVWQPLNLGDPVFWLYDNPGPGRKPLFSCFDMYNQDTFVSDRWDCERPNSVRVNISNYGLEESPLGYADVSPNANGMEGSLQYKILMAISDDGIHWTRFQGADSGGSVIAPQNENTNYFNANSPCCQSGNTRTILHDNGALLPSATVRDGYLELYFYDNSMISWNLDDCGKPSATWRIRIPITEIENPDAYLTAKRQQTPNGFGSDIAWSPMYNRYFIYTTKSDSRYNLGDPSYKSTAMLAWSDCDQDPSLPPVFPDENRFEDYLPVNTDDTRYGRVASSGAITKGVGGQALDFPNGDSANSNPYTVFHLFYQALDNDYYNGGLEQIVSMDLDHLLVFCFPESSATVQVDISPPQGKWRLDNGPELPGGAVSDVSVGNHTIRFSDLDGWNKPDDIDLTISSYCGKILLSGDYEAICYGTLTVNINPSEAIAAGAKWSTDNGATWHNSGETLNLIPGKYTVLFNVLNGWKKPANKTVTIVCDEQSSVNEEMELMDPGSLKVTITPQAAVDSGAQWSIDNGATWHDSEENLDLPGGDYTITFRDIPDWYKPADIPVTVSGDSVETIGEYTEIPMGQLKVIISSKPKQEAVNDGAQWSIDGGATWYDSGVTLDLEAGNYSVMFKEVNCWKKTNDTPVTIKHNLLETIAGNYKKQGALKVIIQPQAAIDAGMKWRIKNYTEWNNNDDTMYVLFGSTQTVEFSAVPGWVTPDDITVSVISCEPPVVRTINVLQDVTKKLERSGNILTYDGQPIRLVGYGAYGLVTEAGFDYQSFLDTLKANNINFVRVWVNYHWTRSLTPFMVTGNEKYDLTKPNPVFYNRLKGFVEYAAARDIIVMVTLFDGCGLSSGNSFYWEDLPYNYENKNNINEFITYPNDFFKIRDYDPIWQVNKRLIDEVTARLGNFGNVIYEIMNEPTSHNFELCKDNKPPPFHSKVAGYLKQVLQSYSGSNIVAANANNRYNNFKRWALDKDTNQDISNVDVVSFHVHDLDDSWNFFDDYDRAIESHFYPKPIIISNDGDITQRNITQKADDYCKTYDARFRRTKCYLRRTFNNNVAKGHYHFEFLDKGLYGSSYKHDPGDYTPNLANVGSYLTQSPRPGMPSLLDLLNGSSNSLTDYNFSPDVCNGQGDNKCP